MRHEKCDFVKLTSQFWKKIHFIYSFYVLYKTCLAWWWLINKVKTCCSISNKILSYINCYNIIINLTHNGMSNLRIMRFQILIAVTMKVAVFLDWQHIMWWPLGVTCWLHLQYPKLQFLQIVGNKPLHITIRTQETVIVDSLVEKL